jgi:hypothetical protein
MASEKGPEVALDESNMVHRIWGSPFFDLIRVRFPWGYADATTASVPTRLGERVVPNRIEVRHPGVGGEPSLSIAMEVIDGVPQCRSLTLSSVLEGRAVTQKDIDFVKLNNWVADTFAAFAFERRGNAFERVSSSPMRGEANGEVERAWAGEANDIAAANDFQRRMKRKITRQLIEESANVYREHFSDNPIQAVSKVMGVGERMASEYIRLARTPEYGFLPKTSRGQKKI